VADPSEVKEAVDWYSKRRVVYEASANNLRSIIQELLESQSVTYHSIIQKRLIESNAR
jgi:hypothetical protein